MLQHPLNEVIYYSLLPQEKQARRQALSFLLAEIAPWIPPSSIPARQLLVDSLARDFITNNPSEIDTLGNSTITQTETAYG